MKTEPTKTKKPEETTGKPKPAINRKKTINQKTWNDPL
jgi:hypothetical protein